MKRVLFTVISIAGILFLAGCQNDTLPETYAITVSPDGAASGESVSADVSAAEQGAVITLTAALNSGRQVLLSAPGITISPSTISSNGSTATFTMPASAVEVTAVFGDIPAVTYAITVSPDGAASGESVSADVSAAEQGAVITLTAALNGGRQVALSAPGITISPSTISSNGSTATFTMPASAVEVTAAFGNIAAGASESHAADTISFNMRYVPSGGPLIMSEYIWDNGVYIESSTQSITLTKNFWMGETEVTQGLWEDVWGTTWPDNDPDDFGEGVGVNFPAYHVSWYNAVAFCNLLTAADDSIADAQQVYYSDAGLSAVYTKADADSGNDVYVNWNKTGYRLPTEAEWEYSARYIDGSNWNHGNHASGDTEYSCYDVEGCSHERASDARISEYAWWMVNMGEYGDPDYGCKEVGLKIANALGLYDMSGNVREWCHDRYAAYSGGAETDPVGAETGSNIFRGGCWNNPWPCLACNFRDDYSPTTAMYDLGFRLCRTAD